jgi:AraC-like DNA-binding protein
MLDVPINSARVRRQGRIGLTGDYVARPNHLFGERARSRRGAPVSKAAAAMTPDTFTTQTFRPRDQAEAWQEWFQPVLDVVPTNPNGYTFPAEIHLWQLGGLAMSRTSAPPVTVTRTKGHLRHDPVDHWIISYCTRGAHSAITAGASLEVPAKVPLLWSLGQQFLHERTHVDRVHIYMPRDAFRDIAPLLDAALGSTLDTALGHLLGDYLIALERCLPSLTAADLPRLSTAVGTMVAAAVAPSVERVSVARGQIDLGRKERVRQAVRRHLRTPTLTPATLSRVVGMSRSNLYRLFEDTGGVARYIQRERLLEAHAALSDPANTKPITVIAEDLCFADASSFSRTFKREFGHSPSEVRAAALAGLALSSVMQRSRVLSERVEFAALLQGF